ncbi:hypothetical protein D3C81_1604440 [compost metagenome]
MTRNHPNRPVTKSSLELILRGHGRSIGEIGTNGNPGVNHAVSGLHRGHFIHIQSDKRGESSHRMTAYGNVSIPFVILLRVILPVDILCRVKLRVNPEGGELFSDLDIPAPSRIPMIVHVESEYDVPSSGHFDCRRILHLLGV